MHSRIRKVDKVWEYLFHHFDILNRVMKDGSFVITAKEIKTIGKYEARLSTKHDSKGDLPNIFKKYGLSLLPISRGSYIIGHFDAFTNLNYNNFDRPIKKKLPDFVESIDSEDITSESIALNIAHASGMISDVLNEEISILTLSGRMGSGELNFKIKNKQNNCLDSLQVKHAQVEIDGAYEGVESLGLIEAKNNVPMDFMVRQLYYPFLLAKKKIIHKKIKPIFFTYSESIFSFHEFEFRDPNIYSSIKKVKQQNYILDIFDDISKYEIMNIYNNTIAEPEPSIKVATFPQADHVGRVMNLLDYINVRSGRSKDELTEKYSFNERQSDYYWNALVYLGFAEKQKQGCNRKLNKYGKRVAKDYSLKEKKLAFVNAMFKKAGFREYFIKVLRNNGNHLNDSEATNIVLNHAIVISNSTVRRRALTLKSWVNWIFSLMKDRQ